MMICCMSCEKDELTLPAKVDFEFSMDAYQTDESVKSMYGFNIDRGTIVVNSIEFDGRRSAGDDYYFTSEFTTPLTAEMHNGNSSQKVSYDIPQGIYEKIDMVFSLGSEYDNSLVLTGSFNQGPLIQIPIRFEYGFQEQIRVKAKNLNGSDEIVLMKDKPAKAKIIFNTPSFFQFVNYNLFQNAVTIEIDGEETILVNAETNRNIFNLLAARINNSVQVVFE